jgi:signal transduction histidine kinase
MKALGGKVAADSEGLGRGSTFTLTLPRATVQEKKTA